MSKLIMKINKIFFLISIILTNNLYSSEQEANVQLIDAIIAGDIKGVNEALENGACSVQDIYGECPLILAIRKNDNDIIKLLLNERADLNSTDANDNSTALMEAAFYGNQEIVKLLLDSEHEVYINSTDKKENTALKRICKMPRRTKIIKLLLDYKADANKPDQNGQTSLMDASEHGLADVVKLLLDADANVNAQPQFPNTRTSLMRAACTGNPETVKVLLDAHANVNATDYSGSNALMFATNQRHANTETIKLLIDANADINAKDRHGVSALTNAAYKSIEATNLLMDIYFNKYQDYILNYKEEMNQYLPPELSNIVITEYEPLSFEEYMNNIENIDTNKYSSIKNYIRLKNGEQSAE